VSRTSDNLEKCHPCAKAGGTLACGECPVSGSKFVKHAAHDFCPLPDAPRFGDGRMPLAWESEGAGDVLRKVLDLPGVNALVGAVKPKGCDCAKRQRAMNRAAPFTAGQ
jgi:hypothetical protein